MDLSKEFWNKYYSEYGKIYGDFPSQSAYDLIRFILDKNNGKKKLKLLELGGGYGRNAKIFSYYNIETTIVDFSEAALTIAKFEMDKERLQNIHLKLEDIFKLNYKEEFDIIYSNFVLHTFENEKRKEMYKLSKKALKNNGDFINSFLSINDPDFIDYSDKKINERTCLVRNKPQHFFTKEEIVRELKESDFDVISIYEQKDPEPIIDIRRNTYYWFCISQKML